jgi:hypothetical protein
MHIEPAADVYSTTTYSTSTSTCGEGCEAAKRGTSEQDLHIRYERATPPHTHDADTKIPSSKYAPTSNVANAKANWTGLVTWREERTLVTWRRGHLLVILSQQVQALSRRASSLPLSTRACSLMLSQHSHALSRSSNPTHQSTSKCTSKCTE